MEMQASRTLAVSQQQAWEALNDPEVLKLCTVSYTHLTLPTICSV